MKIRNVAIGTKTEIKINLYGNINKIIIVIKMTKADNKII